FTSCEKEAKVGKTGSIKVTPMVESTLDANMGKKGTVERGTTPVYVSGITVDTKMGSRNTHTEFDIVENGTEGAASGFIIDDVPLGLNTITAVTSPAEDVKLSLVFKGFGKYETPDWSDPEAQGAEITRLLRAAYKGTANSYNDNIPPYAIYTGSTTATISDMVETDVNIDMDTRYGRLIFCVYPENAYDLADYNVMITADFFDKNDEVVYHNQVLYDAAGQSVTGVWSDENAVHGAKIVLKFQWRADGNGEVLKEESVTMKMAKKQDKFVKIGLMRSSFVMEESGLSFIFDPIVSTDDDKYIN
ncbi:MAG: hypothetical protein KAH32_08910, partial [Chlamydiia bacterium]|nr:hypothetical protein [Chlamydiia bacterium]